MPHSDDTAVFRAVITPYRSLSRAGRWWLIAGIAVLSLGVGVRFWLLGAWPILAFSAAEVALAAAMLYLNQRAGRAVELVTLHRDRLSVQRVDSRGRRHGAELPAAWLSVRLEERSGQIARLWLCQRGQREEIARALGEEEKRELADALREALTDLRNPRFDNAQLREPP